MIELARNWARIVGRTNRDAQEVVDYLVEIDEPLFDISPQLIVWLIQGGPVTVHYVSDVELSLNLYEQILEREAERREFMTQGVRLSVKAQKEIIALHRNL